MLYRDNIFKYRNYDSESNIVESNERFRSLQYDFDKGREIYIDYKYNDPYDRPPQEMSNIPEHISERKSLEDNDFNPEKINLKNTEINMEKSNRKSSISNAAEEYLTKRLPRNKGTAGCRHCGGDGFERCSDGVKICMECIKHTGNCVTCLETGFKLNSSLPCEHRKT